MLLFDLAVHFHLQDRIQIVLDLIIQARTFMISFFYKLTSIIITTSVSLKLYDTYNLYFKQILKLNILGDNWGAVLAENWSEGEIDSVAPSTPRGFPVQVPVKEEQPEFQWIQRGSRTSKERRLDYKSTMRGLTSLTAHRKPGLDRGKDIDQDIYLRRQDEEIRQSSS